MIKFYKCPQVIQKNMIFLTIDKVFPSLPIRATLMVFKYTSFPTVFIKYQEREIKFSCYNFQFVVFFPWNCFIFLLLYFEAIFLGAYKFRIVLLLNCSFHMVHYMETTFTPRMYFFKSTLSDINNLYQFSYGEYLPVTSFPILFLLVFFVVVVPCFLCIFSHIARLYFWSSFISFKLC